MQILFIGDIVGNVGRKAVKEALPRLKSKYNPDFIIANGENAAAGRGITGKIANELFHLGVHGITMGNHTYGNKEIFEIIDDEPRLIRPANYAPDSPGRGYTILRSGKYELGLINIIGRTYMTPADDPFREAERIVDELKHKVTHILVDFHAEATSEKIAMGWHLDGKVTAVVGTHTHVQTHDERILPQGTAYVTDVGMVGPRDGILGMEREAVMTKFLTPLPSRFHVDEGKWHFHAVLITCDPTSGKANHIQLIRSEENEWVME